MRRAPLSAPGSAARLSGRDTAIDTKISLGRVTASSDPTQSNAVNSQSQRLSRKCNNFKNLAFGDGGYYCSLCTKSPCPRRSGKDAHARNPYSRSWLWIPGSLVSLAPSDAPIGTSGNDEFLLPQHDQRIGAVGHPPPLRVV